MRLLKLPLRQRDCALEIAWLRAGYQREWLNAPLRYVPS